MSGDNVITQVVTSPREAQLPLPSAPPQSLPHQACLTSLIYPQLPEDSYKDFRLRKICDCQSELKNEISHYERVLKKYKKARFITHNSSTFVSMTLSALSISGLAISLSGVGAIVGIPISSALMGFVAVGFGIAGKKLAERFLNMKK